MLLKIVIDILADISSYNSNGLHSYGNKFTWNHTNIVVVVVHSS
jgi:hypothetical protein